MVRSEWEPYVVNGYLSLDTPVRLLFQIAGGILVWMYVNGTVEW